MIIRSCVMLCLCCMIAGLGCAGMSGQRFYEEPKGGQSLNDLVDCPDCPRVAAGRESIVRAAPHGGHDDTVVPPHAKFHPVPTRPVFAAKAAPTPAVLEARPTEIITPAVANETAHDTSAKSVLVAATDSDEAPSPPLAQAPTANVKTTSSRSVLKASEPKHLAFDETASALLAAKPTPAPKIEQTSTTPLPAAAPKSDGWRPRAN